MALSESITLPDQPAGGSIEYIPLGGNGFDSPRSAFYGSVNIVGDVSGGLITISVFADPRFEHVVAFLACDKLQEAAAGFRFSIGRASTSIQTEGVTKASGMSGDDFSSIVYAPVAMIDATHWALRMTNVDGVDTRFKFLVYNFNIQASLKVPLSVLLASLPRAPTIV